MIKRGNAWYGASHGVQARGIRASLPGVFACGDVVDRTTAALSPGRAPVPLP